jgi:hypothetical protein
MSFYFNILELLKKSFDEISLVEIGTLMSHNSLIILCLDAKSFSYFWTHEFVQIGPLSCFKELA